MITLTRGQIALLLLALLSVLALFGARLARTGAAEGPSRAAAPVRIAPAGPAAAAGSPLVVHVVGAVRRAGLYRLREGARVADAIRKAGGITPRAAVALVNLAAPLVDGQQVVVPARVEAAVQAGGDLPVPGLAGGKVSLAAATIDQLDELPGIGPVTAQKIVDWRQSHGPFASVDDLDQVPGIGPTRVEQLRDLVTP